MTGEEFRGMRLAMGLTRRDLAPMLGYCHADSDQDYNTLRKMETEKRPISPMCERLMLLIYRDFLDGRGFPNYDLLRGLS